MTAEERFNKFFQNYDIKKDNSTIKDICWLFYSQGVNDAQAGSVEPLRELSTEEFMKLYEDATFIEDIKYWMEHPESGVVQSDDNGYVKVTVPCHDPKRQTCLAWPDRCEECGGNGETCTDLINLYELCGVEPIKTNKKKDIDYSKVLTETEVKELAELISKINRSVSK